MTIQLVEEVTRKWLQQVVIGLNLCPFAHKAAVNQSIRFKVTEARTEWQLEKDLITEFNLLQIDPRIETTLLIHPNVLQDFYAYNEFLTVADDLLIERNFDGVFQIASFHPQYQFGDAAIDAVENYTNRSPYPIVHILREESLTKAIDSHPDTKEIPKRNIKLVRGLGRDKMKELLQACYR